MDLIILVLRKKMLIINMYTASSVLYKIFYYLDKYLICISLEDLFIRLDTFVFNFTKKAENISNIVFSTFYFVVLS
jgi:hypothetical protein